ncbi:YdhR family protein [Pseudochelatococcus sp. B33]
MAKVVLKVAFDMDYSKNEPFEATLERAQRLAQQPGLIWKVWLRDEKNGRGGGVYLFEDRESAQAWIDNNVSKANFPWVSNSVREILEVQEDFSAVTHAKLG